MSTSARTGLASFDEAELIGSIYQAAIQPDQWPTAMGTVARSLGAESSFLFSSHSDTEPTAVLQVHNHAPEMVEGFAACWHAFDPWAGAARDAGLMKRGTLVVGSELVARRDLVRTPFYSDFARPHGIESMLGTVLFDGTENEGVPFTNLCWYRPPGSEEFQRAQKRQLARLVPHFRRALRLQRQTRRSGMQDSVPAAALGGLQVASILLNSTLQVIECNDAAARLLGSGCAASSYRFGQLRSLGLKSTPTLALAMQECRSGIPAALVLQLATPTPQVAGGTLVALAPDTRTHVGSFADERYLLLIKLPRRNAAEVASRVADLFGLSPAEVRVLGMLLEGSAATEIAQATGTRIATVRTHIQAIFGKTGVARQIDLVRLLADVPS